MKSVGVLDTRKSPQAPVHPALARRMLRAGKAAIYRKHPFTIILRPVNGQAALPGSSNNTCAKPLHQSAELLRLKIDPGSRTTGLAVVNDGRREIVWAGELKHRGPEIRKALDHLRAMRRGRRNRKTRYRPARWANRRRGDCHWCGGNPESGKSLCRPCRAKGRGERELDYRPPPRIPPSLMSRVFNVMTWVRRLCTAFPIGAISVEVARFDLQKMENGEIAGVEYQQGTLAGYEVREYLLQHWDRKCAYCGKTNAPLEIEHVIPHSDGGTSRISNLTLACHSCNQKKGNKGEDEFPIPDRVKKHLRAPLKDATMMNVTRYELLRRLRETGLPVETGTGGRTKFNRTRAGLDKSHWADAACVGESSPERWRISAGQVQTIRSRSYARRGRRQACLVNKFGFPRTGGKAAVRPFGYQTGDLVRVEKTKGKWAGVYQGRVSVRSSGDFVFSPRDKEKQPPSFRADDIAKLIDRDGGYEYSARSLSVG